MDSYSDLRSFPKSQEPRLLLEQASRILNQTFIADDDGPAIVELLENLGFAHNYPGALYMLGKLYQEGMEPALE